MWILSKISILFFASYEMIAVHAGAGYHEDDIEKLCASALRESGFDIVRAVMVNHMLLPNFNCIFRSWSQMRAQIVVLGQI